MQVYLVNMAHNVVSCCQERLITYWCAAECFETF
jgi:hypothetical protein